ncbi:phosphoribosylanthranilate isomerase [Haladaptatus sp. F3-133]|uniref:N-(5'-phosphoribosyl)anthranilate isomerase n=1 Tax=Halorutilus salinus TaxID=2487751 RepID=A0A9Q4C5S5_9EURY|nr:phosphoribosylanthranilate isomerase [Halorutilus salinus]MCX2819602.1 phosphoribosylanthranilate isomerase [Halorutilus salinus]
MTRTKVCGINSREELDAVVRAGVDAVGFVTEVPVDTHRKLDRDETRELVDETPPFVTTVAVTMPDDDDNAEALARETGADAVQVHNGVGASGAARHAKIVERTEFEEPSDEADAVIVDSTDAEGAGGTGEKTDWGAAARFVDKTALPVVLAGGLEPSNVARAIRRVEPYAVDVSSGVERNGTKDDVLVGNFVRGVDDADAV